MVRLGSKSDAKREIQAKDAKPGGMAVDNGNMAKEKSVGRRNTGEMQEAQSRQGHLLGRLSTGQENLQPPTGSRA